MAGKGSKQRPTNKKKFDEAYERIFGKKGKKWPHHGEEEMQGEGVNQWIVHIAERIKIRLLIPERKTGLFVAQEGAAVAIDFLTRKSK